MEDYRSDFYKFLDAIKSELNQEEYIKIHNSNRETAKDVLKNILMEGTLNG